MVYGHLILVTEESACDPLGIYGTLKYSGELIVKAYSRVFDLPIQLLGHQHFMGKDVSRRVGQIFIENAVQNLDITINGDGSDKLDFTYIDDLIHGVNCVIIKNSINETFNLTYGEARTIGEMAEILQKDFDKININYIPKDHLTPDRGTLNIDKARDLLGYNPINSIDQGYPKYIQWYKSFWDSIVKK